MLRVMPGPVLVARSEPTPVGSSDAIGPDAPSVQRPALRLLYSEPFRAVAELAQQKMDGWGKAVSANAAPGDGHPVVIFPGLGGGGKSVATLRAHCQSLGYEAFDWGQGLNTGPKGDLDAWLLDLKLKIEDLLEAHVQPATFIGWSLGGLYARELGKLMAPRVRQVITLGTPFNAEADHSNVGWLYRLLGGGSSAIDPALSRRLRTPPPLRTTSIYSRSDGVVAWQTCRHSRLTRLVHDVEIKGSHIGMGWNRDVLAVIADRLVQRPGPWRAYERTH